MELTVWTYEGPPHVGAMRIATSMEGVHLVLHSPQGDTYADLLFTMIERHQKRPPVTYTTFQARDLGGDTAKLVLNTLQEASERFKPEILLVSDSCTAELIQDQPGSLAEGADLPVPVIPIELSAYSRKENWGAAETFYHLVRGVLLSQSKNQAEPDKNTSDKPSVNLLGPSSLGFRCRDDVTEVTRLLESIGVDVNVVAPLSASPRDLLRIPEAQANVCLYPEVAQTTCDWLSRSFGQATIKNVPIGVGATRDFVEEVCTALGLEITTEISAVLGTAESRLPWYSRSIDSSYLTDKRVFIFADATHAVAAARIARDELGFEVVGIGTYSKEQARMVRATAKEMGLTPLISDNYLEVEAAINELQPELVLGTQMERHIAKRFGIGCAVISTPAHVQDFPARYSPQMGFEGANVIFDSWVHPLMMGLEEHLLTMFREDFEFNDDATPSHLVAESANSSRVESNAAISTELENSDSEIDQVVWQNDAEDELNKIPFFVRGKARRNTERYATEQGVASICIETLYEAKAHYSR